MHQILAASPFRILVRAALVAASLAFLVATAFTIAADQKATDPPKSLSDELPRIPATEPRDALKTFKVQRGFSLELVASEPLVSDPVDACFDENGRMFVAEMHGYPYSFEPRAQQNPKVTGKKDAGVIRLLEDTDGDGKMDKSVVFAKDLSWPTSVCCSNGGVFVIAPPHLYYFKDNDGDDRADVREVVFSGFNRSNVQGLSNNLKWGLDNRIWLAAGRNGVALEHRGKDLPDPGRRDLSFDPRTEEIEPVSGGQQFGHSMDDWGNRFVCSNSNHIQHVVFPDRYLKRNPYLAGPSPVRSIAKEGAAAPVYRKSPAEPWRIVRTRRRAADPKYNKRLPPTELVPIGFFTSATGVTIYRGGAYPAEYRGNAFIGDVGGNLVHRKTLEPAGASFIASRADENVEFITSTDNWFRPVNFVNAPDGTLYILDMYRETIEHPASIPEDIKSHLNLESGDHRGRIYRLAPPTWQRTPPPKLGASSIVELVAQLESANSWNRETAQRLLVERGDKQAVEPLRKLIRESNIATARLHALYTLSGLDSLTPGDVRTAFKDDNSGVREHALRLAEKLFARDPQLVRQAAQLRDDEDYRVRLQLAYSLGEARTKEAVASLVETAVALPDDATLRMAFLTSVNVGDRAARIASAMLEGDGLKRPGSKRLLYELVQIMGTDKDSAGAVKLVSTVFAQSAGDDQKQFLLRPLAEGLSRRGSTITAFVNDPEITAATREGVARLFKVAAETAVDEGQTIRERTAAAGLLAYAGLDVGGGALAELLDPQVPQTLQAMAVRSLAEHADPRVPKLLLESWRNYSPTVRKEVVDALFGRTDRLTALLTAVEKKTVLSGEIERDKKQILLNHTNAKIRDRAREVFGSVDANRRKIVDAYKSSLDAGDAAAGRVLFKKTCSVCHKVGNEGHQVGPDLATVKNKSPADLLVAILDPNREAQPNYNVYTVVTQEGKLINGIIAAETAASLTLRRAEGKQDVVLRNNIESLTSNGKSIMPEGLEKDVTPKQMADLIAFVRTIKPQASTEKSE